MVSGICQWMHTKRIAGSPIWVHHQVATTDHKIAVGTAANLVQGYDSVEMHQHYCHNKTGHSISDSKMADITKEFIFVTRSTRLFRMYTKRLLEDMKMKSPLQYDRQNLRWQIQNFLTLFAVKIHRQTQSFERNIVSCLTERSGLGLFGPCNKCHYVLWQRHEF